MAYTENLEVTGSADATAELEARAEGTPPSCGSDSASLKEAQTKAREWADRAIELSEAGEVEQARIAEVHAEIWLSRMLKIESTLRGVPRLTERMQRPAYRPARTALANRVSAPAPFRAQLSSIPAMDQSTVANSVMLRAWKRPAY